MRKYYSKRNSKSKNSLNLGQLRDAFFAIYEDFKSNQFFDEAFGLNCVDGLFPGIAGENLEGYVFKKIRKQHLWPIHLYIKQYSRDDVFDLIEFLFDHISKPLEKDRDYHSFNDCGWHYKNFDKLAGQKEFSSEINQFLNDYGDGYELSISGEILLLGEPEFKLLLETPVPTDDYKNIISRIDSAVSQFRKYGSTLEDRAEAIRKLADCLEFIRPQIKKVLNSSDENDLFNIINNFGVRHHNVKQQTNYDKNIWLSWMFYFYLATLHACTRLIDKKKYK